MCVLNGEMPGPCCSAMEWQADTTSAYEYGEVALHLNNRLDAMVPGFVRHARSKQITAVEAERFTPKGEVGRYKFPPMVMAEVEARGGLDLELRALQWLYGTSLPRSGLLPVSWPTLKWESTRKKLNT